MTVTAVVVRWRGGHEVDRCLRSLLDGGGRRLARVVLVDSGSGDGGAERLADAFPAVDVVALSENRSFAHAANRGADRGRDRLILLLNPDTEMIPGALDILVDTLDGAAGAAGAVPLLIGADGRPQHRWQLRRLPSPIRLAAGLSGPPAFAAPPSEDTPVEQPAAAAWLVRREVWQALDGLDEAFSPAWWEDVDFCARLADRLDDPGFPAAKGFLVVPSARVVHQGGSSLKHLDEAAFLATWASNLLER